MATLIEYLESLQDTKNRHLKKILSKLFGYPETLQKLSLKDKVQNCSKLIGLIFDLTKTLTNDQKSQLITINETSPQLIQSLIQTFSSDNQNQFHQKLTRFLYTLVSSEEDLTNLFNQITEKIQTT